MSAAPVLDWIPRHDPESIAYPIRSLIGETVARVFNIWQVGPCLDQGREGACVGHGWTSEATSAPVLIDFARQSLGVNDLGVPWPTDPQAFAFALYEWCRRHDEFIGEDYDGTSVLTGAKGMKMLGFLPEFRWAFGLDDVIDTLVTYGPVVLGIEWHDGMYDAPGGELRATGEVVGGHCLLAVGYDPEHRWADGTVTPAVALYNSWGRDWGINGLAWIRATELGDLLSRDGEACVPVRRTDPAGDPVAPAPQAVVVNREAVVLIKALIRLLERLLERLEKPTV